MSNEGFFTNYTGTDKASEALGKLRDGLAEARKLTAVLIDDGDSPYTLTDTLDIVSADATSGAVTILLPTAPVDGDTFEVYATDVSNTVTIDRNGNSINQAASNDTISAAFSDVKKYTWVSADNTWFRR